MRPRFIRLYLMGITSFFNRLRFDLSSEIVVALSSGILFATFFYIFNDFINVQVASLSPAMRHLFATCCAYTLLVLVTAVSSRNLRREQSAAQSLSQTAKALGEIPSNLNLYLVLRHLTVLIFLHSAAWYVILAWLVPWPWPHILLCESIMLAATGLALLIPMKEKLPSENTLAVSSGFSQNALHAMVEWRWRQILTRNRMTRLCLAIGCGFFVLVAYTATLPIPVFVSVAAALAGGLLMGIALTFQLAEDLNYAWAERIFGISHENFVRVYTRLGWRLGIAAALLAGAAYLIGLALSADKSMWVFDDTLKVLIVASLPSLVAPHLLFQIDGRRPAINTMILLIVALFLGTAVFAHWLGLLLLPLVKYYGNQTQAGRFYRA